MSLAVAEAEYQFEHRDLHLGNILVSRTNENRLDLKLKGLNIELQSGGLRVVIIDFTLSRIRTDEVTIFKDLAQDPELFAGQAKDPQVFLTTINAKHLRNVPCCRLRPTEE